MGLFFDYPSEITFDIGYTRQDLLEVRCKRADLYVYVITGESAYDVAKQFRKIIGKSYIPPKYAFGFGQSRWGYKTEKDIETVVEGYRGNQIPLDMVYMDIDYMQDFKDFTINPERFPNFPDFVKKMQQEQIHLIPIIDAGVKLKRVMTYMKKEWKRDISASARMVRTLQRQYGRAGHIFQMF